MKRLTATRLNAIVALLLAVATPAQAIEGCKMKQKVEVYKHIYFRLTPVPGYADSFEYSWNYPLWGECYNCTEWDTWLQQESGEKCYTIGATTSLSSFLQADHSASSSMTYWLEIQLGKAPGSYTTFNPYGYTISTDTASSCTSTYVMLNAVTDVGYGQTVSYQIKDWRANLSGSACPSGTNETTVTP